nr:PREDICTED: alpha-N-acetylglucosaminidase-like [Bemisia tabaci]
MALNGINMALAFNGQEAVWNRVYKKFNMKEADIDKHFTGPAFLAWGRMGNMRGFGGPLNDNWHEKSLVLQHKILARMRLLGINPVLPAFSGQVPRSFKE